MLNVECIMTIIASDPLVGQHIDMPHPTTQSDLREIQHHHSPNPEMLNPNPKSPWLEFY